MQGHLLLFLGLLPLAQMAVGTYVWINSEWVWKPEVGKETPIAGVDSVVEGSGSYDDSYDEGENDKEDYEDDDGEYGEYGSGIKNNNNKNQDWTEKAPPAGGKKKNQKGGAKGTASEPTFNNMNQNVFNNNNNKKTDDIGFHEEAGGTSTTSTTTLRVPVLLTEPRAEEPAVTTVSSVERNPNSHSTSFFAQPGILAAVIGGAVVGLLCAILLVMFIVYRMRKKDEGSYALDEPRRSPNVHLYSKAPTREFFA